MHQRELTVARCRVLLSVFAVLAIYVDPTPPVMLPWLQLRGGPFAIDPYTLAILAAHLASSLTIYAGLARGVFTPQAVGAVTTWTDVLFAGAIAAVTEGVSSPFYVFFVFSIIASGFRYGTRRVTVVIAAATGIYLSLILVSRSSEELNFYIMRPVYLAVVGYLIAYLGEQRVSLEARVRRLEAQTERARIASTLHDGSLQTLVAVNLRLDACRELLREARYDEALEDISALEAEIAHEHERLRSYVRDLARAEQRTHSNGGSVEPRVSIDLRLAGTPALVEDVLQITREAVTNVKRHAAARSAAVAAREGAGRVEVAVDDDGVGFPVGSGAPGSIASRVEAAGGDLRLEHQAPGAHLRIILPTSEDAG